MERDDEAYLNEILATKNSEEDTNNGSKPNAIDVKVVTDDMTYEEILELVILVLIFSIYKKYV